MSDDSKYFVHVPQREKIKILISISVICHSICIALGYLAAEYLPPFKDLRIPWHHLWSLYFLTGVLGTTTHWAGHHRFSGRWFRAHTMEHHIKIYPPKRFLSDVEIVADDGNAKFYIPTMIFPLFFTYFLYGGLTASVISSGWVISWLAIVDYFHGGYHQRNHFLERFHWFYVLRDLHMQHHKGDMLTNYGVMDFTLDALCGNLAVSA